MDPAGVAAADVLNDEIVRFVRRLKASGNTVANSTARLLWPLMNDGPMRPGELAEVNMTDQSTVSRQVAQLVRSGLIRRDVDPADNRACLLALTEQGIAVCETMKDQRRTAVAEALSSWSSADLATFAELFTRFNDAIEEHANPVNAGPGGTASTQEKM